LLLTATQAGACAERGGWATQGGGGGSGSGYDGSGDGNGNGNGYSITYSIALEE
jgi:hypothetical protein